MKNPILEKWIHEKLKVKQNCQTEKINRQKELGKKTAWQRIELLVDEDSFEQIDEFSRSPFLEKKFYTDGVITGFAKINGQQIAIYSQDFTLKGGSLGLHHAKKICKIMDMAVKIGCPIIGIIDSGGARIDEGIHALAGYGKIFFKNTRYSGVIPQISIILGPCAGGAAYSPALTDFIFTTNKISNLFITGPLIIEQALHQKITKEELGGAKIHTQKSGVAHFIAQTEIECFEQVKKLLSYLPANYLDDSNNNFESKPQSYKNIAIDKLVPENLNKSYDIKTVIKQISDQESFLEVQSSFAPNIVIGFSKIGGQTVGIVANQPLFKAGAIDINASCKAARFINFCDNFSIPIISFVDVPGFMPGIDQEHNGIIRHGAKLLHAYSQATVAKITIILRKAFGGAYIVMGSKHLGADFNFAWPNAQIAVMGASGAISILHGKKLKKITDKTKRIRKQKELENKYSQDFLNPFIAAEFGYIDAIIDPNKTRKHLINALHISKNKVETLPKKKNSNIPL